MVHTGVLSALVLLSLLSSCQSVEEVDLETLAKITEVFLNKYQPPGMTGGHGLQFATAINVPVSQCKLSRNVLSQNFLSNEDTDKVKEDLSTNNLYQGNQLVAATPKRKGKIHSERTLLMCTNLAQAVTPVQNLLNKDTNGCVVFYTYNSPCLEDCLNQKKAKDTQNQKDADRKRAENRGETVNTDPAVTKCILDSLSMLSNHNGPKAFVFSRVYRNDENKPDLAAALKTVAEKVPLYKCISNKCVKCLKNNEIDNQCLS